MSPEPTGQPPRVDDALRLAQQALPGGEARAEAELLLAHALGRSRSWLYAHPEARIDAAAAAAFERLLARRAAGEPVAYLLGRRGFWAFDLAVSPHTLIPRPETERLVELALERIPRTPGFAVADLGTGSGAIALAIAHERRQARVMAVDVSEGALEVARGNARALGLGQVEFRQGDWWAPLAGERFAVVVSNPPYIAEDDAHLRQGDLRHEPLKALASGRDGLDAISAIVRDAPEHLLPGGWLLLEHGLAQGEAVRGLLGACGFASVHTHRDLEGRDRVTIGMRS